jgi:hypothetical protein
VRPSSPPAASIGSSRETRDEHSLVDLGTAAALVVLTGRADAKCGFQQYRINIDVRSSRSNEPVSDVRVAVFANGEETEMSSREVKNIATTDTNGRLARTYLLNTYSGPGILRVERCGLRLRTLEVIVTHPVYRARRLVMKRIQVSSRTADDVVAIEIPSLLVDPVQP